MIKGIDVSTHNQKINWGKVRQTGTSFAIIRAGYGKSTSQKDAQFENNYSGCKTHGINCGVYWYSYAVTREEAVSEAKACLEVIKNKKLEYPVYFDIEDKIHDKLSQKVCSEMAKAFCDTIESSGYFAGIYSYKSFLENKINPEILKRYTVWVAHTDVEKTSYKYPYGIWQYSHKGSVDGIDGAVDLNHCYIDFSSIIKARGLNGFGKVPDTGKIKQGSIVMLSNGAKSYTGESLAGFVYTRNHTVSEINGNRAVITYNNVVVAAVNTADLTLIK